MVKHTFILYCDVNLDLLNCESRRRPWQGQPKQFREPYSVLGPDVPTSALSQIRPVCSTFSIKSEMFPVKVMSAVCPSTTDFILLVLLYLSEYSIISHGVILCLETHHNVCTRIVI